MGGKKATFFAAVRRGRILPRYDQTGKSIQKHSPRNLLELQKEDRGEMGRGGGNPHRAHFFEIREV